MSKSANLPTHVVADASSMITYDDVQPFRTFQVQLQDIFGILADDQHHLTNELPMIRPDLLIGLIDRTKRFLVIQGDSLGLDPHSSSVVKHVCEQLGLKGCRRVLINGVNGDRWDVALADMRGDVPETLYHGTSEDHLTSIRDLGIILNEPPNWPFQTGHVHLTASPQIAAIHAKNAAANRESAAIVIACAKPNHLLVDWDVERAMVRVPTIPSLDGVTLSREAGLFATPDPIPPEDIKVVTYPRVGIPYSQWAVVSDAITGSLEGNNK